MNRNTIAAVSATLMAFAVSPAWAVNKCTAPDGKVQFQDAPCNRDVKLSETVRSAPAMTGVESKSWEFSRTVDDMTGRVTCNALSPVVYVSKRVAGDMVPMQIGVSALAGEKFLAFVRIAAGRDIFHNDISGMGIKAEPGSFLAINIKAGQKVTGFQNSAPVLDALALSRSAKLRVRIWPYDDLLDSGPIAAVGLPQAVRMAAECAKKSS